MKTIMTKWAMLLALMTAVSCSETETEIDPEPGGDGDGQVALGINPNLKVDAGMKSATKAVVSGTSIAYPSNEFTSDDYAPGIGIFVTNKAANGWYAPDEANGGYTGHHVWYIGNNVGEDWKSIAAKGGTFADTQEKPYYLTKDVGQVFAYYPYDAGNTSAVSSATDLKIPVKVLTTGTIDAMANNAKKYWNTDQWSPTSRINLVNLSLSTEKDYLYFDGTGGRYVNNGRAEGQPPVRPDADPANTNADNPGYKINLAMKHAMAMVSFRVYDGGQLSSNDVKFTKFEIKNHAGASSFKTGEGKMSLTDGVITGNTAAGSLARTITDYILMRQIETGGVEGEHAFVQTGATSATVNGQTVSKTVSAIVYPIRFYDNEIDVDITLKEGGNTPVVYTVALPEHEWTAGSNCIYTFSAGRNKLTVMDVTVEEWIDDPQVEIPL